MSRLTKEEMAARLDGREYREEMTADDEVLAHDSGLIVIFGASDDLVEFRGVVTDEIGMYGSGPVLIDEQGPLPKERDDDWSDDEMADYFARKKRAVTLRAEWCERDDFSWSFQSPVPVAEFNIMEGTEHYCRGIVIDVRDLEARR
jgi:hypothetical protein